jgi:hypothetical protein
MTAKEYLKFLEQRYDELKAKLEILDKDVVRERKFDFEVMGNVQLEKYIESNSDSKEKIKSLLSQIGYLRINIFYECYARIQASEKISEFDSVLQLMNEYIEQIALPFLLPKLKQSWLSRLSGKPSEAALSLQSWRSGYKYWLERENSLTQKPMIKKKAEDFTELKQTFITLYSLSFSCVNFPPVCGAEEREYL